MNQREHQCDRDDGQRAGELDGDGLIQRLAAEVPHAVPGGSGGSDGGSIIDRGARKDAEGLARRGVKADCLAQPREDQRCQHVEKENDGIVKSGRTHLQDATPITFSQEISGWRSSLEKDKKLIEIALPELKELALGGTAVGTGLNAPKGFDEEVAKAVCEITGKDFVTAENKFHALTSKDEIVFAHGALKALACDLMKIANDIRWLASGPRLGLGEITIPENEPGSSIMPGKVNPTQCEAVTMVSVQVMGNDAAIGFAASQGNFELNVFMPVTIYNFLQSVRLLSEAMISFNKNCVSGIKANKEKMDCNLHNSLMLVTALNPYIGYENAAKTAKYAYKNNISLKEACTTLGFLSEEKFEKVFHPEQMV